MKPEAGKGGLTGKLVQLKVVSGVSFGKYALYYELE